MAEAPVVVVGGGAAGLSCAGALARSGIRATIIEQDAAIGGTWARRYDRLRLHTVRRFSGLAHFPIPRQYPTYLSRDQVIAYLNEYAQHFALNVVTSTAVRAIRRDGETHEWHVDTSCGVWQSRVVVVATGQFREPIVPAWPGRDEFSGPLTHSSAYANASAFAGQRVLVVGAGNSGAEIATDLADGGAASVTISVRTSPPIVPRDPFGMPVQRTSILLSALPPAVANAFGRLTARLTIGDLTAHGLPPATFNPYTTKRVPMIDVGFVDALKRGRVRVRPALVRLTRSGAVFADGSTEAVDAIIAATGFATGLDRWLDVPGVLDAEGMPLGRPGEPTAAEGLYFVGFTHSLRGHLFEANRASRRLAAQVSRYLSSSPVS